MSNSADNSPLISDLDEDSDVIELTNEVAEHTIPPDDDLAFAIPAFRVPTGQVPSISREHLGQSSTDDAGEEDPFDREELVRTVRMEAVDRSQIELFDAVRKFSISEYLDDHRFAPDLLVVPPRVLTKKWQDGPAMTLAKTAGGVEDRASHASTIRVTTVTDADIAKATEAALPEPSPEPVAQPVQSAPEVAETPLENKSGADAAPEEILPPPSLEREDIQDAIELDNEILEDATPLPKPPPKPDSPIERPRQTTKPLRSAVASGPPPERRAESAQNPVATSGQNAAAKPRMDGDDDIGGIVQELLEEKKPAKRQSAAELKRANWFVDLFSDEFMRTLPKDLPNQTSREVAFILDSLGLKKGARIFDLACGFGRHSLELARRGYEVAGLDLSMPLLQRALTDAQKRSLSIKFIHGDMRDLNFNEIFDGAFLWQTSFGYFDDRTNFRVLQGVHRSLKPGGRFLIDVVNRDYVVAEMPSRTWWEGVECVFLEEVEFDYMSSVMHTKRSFIYEDGSPPQEFNSYIRLYGLHELNQILQIAGFEVVEVSGEIFHRGNFLGPSSSHILVMAEKR